MKIADDHPWIARFVGVEAALVVIAVVLVLATGPSPANPSNWDPIKVTGLLLGAWAIILAALGTAGAIGYLIWKAL